MNKGKPVTETQGIKNAVKFDPQSICQELESCRKLKSQLTEEATKQFPFKGEFVSKQKLGDYTVLLHTLILIYEREDYLIEQIPQTI